MSREKYIRPFKIQKRKEGRKEKRKEGKKKETRLWTGKIVQWERVCPAFPGDPSSVPAPMSGGSQLPVIPAANTLCWLS